LNSTIAVLVAALALTSGGLGLVSTGILDTSDGMDLASVIPKQSTATALIAGHVEVWHHNSVGELLSYRQIDNEVVTGGEHCILKMLFTAGSDRGANNTATNEVCTGALTGGWTNIAIGTGSTAAADADTALGTESTVSGLSRAAASTVTWQTTDSPSLSKIQLSKTFTSADSSSHTITESGLFNSTTVSGSSMLARQVFTGVALSDDDSITITWTFTVGN